MGNEGSGVVVQSRHAAWEAGARVAFTGRYGMLRDGNWADAAVVDAAHLARVPDAVPLATAAAMPVAYLSAYLALQQAKFSPGKVVLALGGRRTGRQRDLSACERDGRCSRHHHGGYREEGRRGSGGRYDRRHRHQY
jgi:hypothetical protein